MAAQMLRRPVFLFSGLCVYAGATTATYLTLYKPKDSDVINELSNEKRKTIFGANAKTYDKDIGWDEKLTGISLMRRWLLRSSHGNVLEIAAGTGKNLPYYPPKLEKVVLTDFSEPMLEELKDKKEFKQLSPEICHCTAMNADALAFADESFDTVIDTFGLCSIANVKQALQEMQRVCKRDGTILLLEHGRSHYAWLSSILDKFAGKHAHKWGCEWNRDIEKLVQDAGFEIQTIRRFHFGTTYYIIAKPTRERVAKLVRE